MTKPTHRRYSSLAIHDALLARRPSEEGVPGGQALFCPYFTPLKGTMGSDWGAILNPESVRFGQLVQEHHACGCPDGSHGWGNQRVDEWHDRAATRRELAERFGGGKP